MANANLSKVDLKDIDLYEKGEKATANNLNKPILQLKDNIVNQKSVLDSVIDMLSSSNTSLDDLQEVVNFIENIKKELNDLTGSTASFNGDVKVKKDIDISGTLIGTTATFSDNVTSKDGKLASEKFVQNGFYSIDKANDEFMSRQDILNNYTSKKEAEKANEPVLLSSVGDLQGDWVDYDSDGTTGWNAVISKTSDGWVHISGIVKGDKNGTNIIENLQDKFRPKKKIMSSQKVYNDDGKAGVHRVDIYTDGIISIYDKEGDRPSDSTDWVNLDFIYYAGV